MRFARFWMMLTSWRSRPGLVCTGRPFTGVIMVVGQKIALGRIHKHQTGRLWFNGRVGPDGGAVFLPGHAAAARDTGLARLDVIERPSSGRDAANAGGFRHEPVVAVGHGLQVAGRACLALRGSPDSNA